MNSKTGNSQINMEYLRLLFLEDMPAALLCYTLKCFTEIYLATKSASSGYKKCKLSINCWR